jgi:preprotein translocase subunit SecF
VCSLLLKVGVAVFCAGVFLTGCIMGMYSSTIVAAPAVTAAAAMAAENSKEGSVADEP